MSDDDWRSGVVWLRQERQMRIDDTTMLMVRVDDDRPAAQPGTAETGTAETGTAETGIETAGDHAADVEPLGWIQAAAKDVKSVSDQVAQQAEQTSERVIQGLRGLKERALKKYRETFGKKNDPPQE